MKQRKWFAGFTILAASILTALLATQRAPAVAETPPEASAR